MLKKIDNGYYTANINGIFYELKKGFRLCPPRSYKVYRMYKNGVYMGQPETIKDANQWIKEELNGGN